MYVRVVWRVKELRRRYETREGKVDVIMNKWSVSKSVVGSESRREKSRRTRMSVW